VVGSVGCADIAGVDVGVGFVLAGLAVLGLAGLTELGFASLVDFDGFSALEGFAFTLTGRGAVFTAAARKEAERRWALAGVAARPTPRRIERTASTRLRRGTLARALDIGTTGVESGLGTNLEESGLGTNLEQSGLGTNRVESSTPGSAFDMRQGYARDVTIR
jgi:hypothetical protein